MSITLSLLRKDLLASPRRKWFYMKRSAFVIIAAVIILWGLGIGALTQTTTVGLLIFKQLAFWVLLAICFLSALTGGMTIVREKVERTLGLLFLTDISCARQVLGKLCGSVFFTTVTVLSVFPMFVLCAILGGVSPIQIIAAFAVLLGTMFLGSCIGLFTGTVTRNEKTMVFFALLIIGIIFALLPIGIGVGFSLAGKPADKLLRIVSSFVVMNALTRETLLVPALWNCLFSMILGLPFLLLTYIILPRRIISEANIPLSRLVSQRIRGIRGLGRWFTKPAIKGNPVAWKELNVTYGGARQEWVMCGLVSVAIAAIICVVSWALDSDASEAAILSLAVVAGCAALVFGLSSVVRAARSINSEIRDHTMPVLLTSGLSEKEIIKGKLWAIFRSCLPWLICSIGCALLAAIIGGAWETLLFIAGYGVYSLAEIFVFVCFALFLSIHFKTAAVLGICFPSVILWSSCVKQLLFIPSMFLLPFMGAFGAFMGPLAALFVSLAFLLMSIGIDIVVGLLFLHLLHKNFRLKAMKEM